MITNTLFTGGIFMYKIAFYDTKPYDREWFEKMPHPDIEFVYYEHKLDKNTAEFAKNCDGVCAFVNDTIDKDVINTLYNHGIHVIAMRCAGYNGLTGFDLHGKTVGVIGTGKIGQVFIDICRGFKMDVIAYDPYPLKDSDINYVSKEELFKNSDIISLHCPLTDDTKHIINKKSLQMMKDGVYILNTSRGRLIESESLYEAIKNGKVGAAGLDVYEEESDLFFEDCSDRIIRDDVLKLFLSLPNVLITSHQAFLTAEALSNIAKCTINNITAYFNGDALENEICYGCIPGEKHGICHKKEKGRCF